MTAEPTLEELWPREWIVTWEYPSDPAHLDGRWFAQDRTWPDEESAVRHAHALSAIGAATQEVRSIEVCSRMVALEAGEWVPVRPTAEGHSSWDGT